MKSVGPQFTFEIRHVWEPTEPPESGRYYVAHGVRVRRLTVTHRATGLQVQLSRKRVDRPVVTSAEAYRDRQLAVGVLEGLTRELEACR